MKSNLKVLEKIGAGHHGEVFRGEDPVHGIVAVKRLKATGAHTAEQWEQYKEALLNEALCLKQADHENVVKVLQLLEDDNGNDLVMVMELCDGGSLQDKFDQGPMSLKQVRRIGTQVALGVQSLHAKAMLHRDIKPGNILLTGNDLAKLGDFGLVTDQLILGYADGAGYYDHLPPEVRAGEGASVRSDVWALGMTLYRLLHGKSWYEAAPEPKDLIPDGGFVDTLKWLPHIPKAWRATVRSMLRDDRAERLQSAAQVVEALGRLPVEPDWVCEVRNDAVKWATSNRKRRIEVVWDQKIANKHRWQATSFPVGAGRTRSLAGSNGAIPRKQAEKELQRFFASKLA